MKCFYHTDADGICSGYIVRYFQEHLEEEQQYIPINYGMKFPLESIQAEELVYIVDYSIEPSEMEELMKITKGNVVWIDHHKTAIEKYKTYKDYIPGLRYDGIAGCMLTWFYFNKAFPPCDSEVENAPQFVQLIADYDVWTFKHGEQTRYFQLAFNAENYTPESKKMDFLMEDDADGSLLNRMILDGKAMLKYRDGWSKTYCETLGFETEFEGHKAFAMNLGMCGRDNFKGVSGKEYDLLIGFVFDGEKWRYSLRSKNIDVSEIAKKYGGGGHRGAAGFEADTFLLKGKRRKKKELKFIKIISNIIQFHSR